MDEATNRTIKEHEIQTNEWVFSDLSQELYTWFDLFNKRFFENKLQNPVISFQKTRINSLGHFVLDRNEFGLKWNINLNRRYVDLPLIDKLSILLHEQCHLWQQEFGKKKSNGSRNNYHNVEFRAKAYELGIPSSIYGVTLAYKDPFLLYLKEHGVDLKSELFSDDGCCGEFIAKYKGFRKKGKSKLKKWSCGCTNIRVAVSDFWAKCLNCGNEFKKNEDIWI